jgi:hypothetical protein
LENKEEEINLYNINKLGDFPIKIKYTRVAEQKFLAYSSLKRKLEKMLKTLKSLSEGRQNQTPKDLLQSYAHLNLYQNRQYNNQQVLSSEWINNFENNKHLDTLEVRIARSGKTVARAYFHEEDGGIVCKVLSHD